MKDEMKLYGLFGAIIVIMAIAYPGSTQEPAETVRTVEAKEVVISEYPAPAENEVVVEPNNVDLLTYSFVEKSEEPELMSLGTFKVTAYCKCQRCCKKYAENRPKDKNGNEIVIGASGQELTAGYSIAVDPTVIPYGNEVYLNGKKYVAQDCGVKGNCIDLYMSSHEEAVKWGVQYLEVFKGVDK